MLLPSLQEGFSIVLLEAMALARPIVATRVSGNPEAVLDGQTGLLVPPTDPDAISTAVIYYLTHQDIAREMGMRGQTRLREEFTLAAMTRQYERLYLHAYRQTGG